MRSYKSELEIIASDFLDQNVKAQHGENKPNYSNRDFMNAIIIFQTAIFDKLWDNQTYIEMEVEDRMKMAVKCGEDLRNLILEFTGLDTHNFNEFI